MNDKTKNAEQEIMRAEGEWTEIYLKNDADNFENLLTDDFLYTSPFGEVVDRATYLKNLRERIVVMDYVNPSDVLVRVHNETAIVTALWDVKETYKGQGGAGEFRILRVWLRQPDRWRAVAFQVTAKQSLSQTQ